MEVIAAFQAIDAEELTRRHLAEWRPALSAGRCPNQKRAAASGGYRSINALHSPQQMKRRTHANSSLQHASCCSCCATSERVAAARSVSIERAVSGWALPSCPSIDQ